MEQKNSGCCKIQVQDVHSPDDSEHRQSSLELKDGWFKKEVCKGEEPLDTLSVIFDNLENEIDQCVTDLVGSNHTTLFGSVAKT